MSFYLILKLQTFYDGFKETDKNHDGFVDAEEMKSLLGGVDKSYDDLKAAEQAIRNHDKNGKYLSTALQLKLLLINI